MRDDAWWDGDDEHVAALQERLLPLREPSAPWGDVLARARVATTEPPRRRVRFAAISAAAAAALVLAWAWTRVETEPGLDSRADLPVVDVVAPAVAPTLPIRRSEITSGEHARSAHSVPSVEDVANTGHEDVRVRHPRRRSRPRPASPSRVASEPTRSLAEGHEQDPFEVVIAPAAPVPTADDCEADPKGSGCNSALPDAPSSGEIGRAVESAQALARVCRETHGGTVGDRVVVELTITGATGQVTSSRAMPPFAETDLGRCVAEAGATATFPRFRLPKLSVVYPFEL